MPSITLDNGCVLSERSLEHFHRAGAMFDSTGTYRYQLWREWVVTPMVESDHLVFLMLNPSTADHEVLDPTVRKCVEFAKRWGYGGLQVLNIFAFKATDPDDMVDSAEAGIDIVGPFNDDSIERVCLGRRVVMACGAHRFARDRLRQVMPIVERVARDVVCLKTTKDGLPGHPLYIPYAVEPKPWRLP